MTIKQLSVFLENKPGHLSQLCNILTNKGINLLNMMIADTKDFGIVRIIVKEWETAKLAFEENGFTVTVVDVALIEVDNQPGGLAKLLTFFGEENLGIDYMYAFPQAFSNNQKSVIVIKFNDLTSSTSILQKNKDKIIGSSEFYKEIK